jgi:outer membrane receptor for Fe3+-dicitrate
MGREVVRVLILLLAIVSVYMGVSAQSREIKGTVNDQNGAAVIGATVALRNKKTGLERIVQTDSQGQFRFTDLAEGEYEIIVTAKGFRQVTIPYENQPEIIAILEIEPFEKATIIYSGSRQEELRESLNTKVDVITSQQIRDTGYETVGEVLRELPGVLTRRGSETGTSFGAAESQVQGIGSRQTLVLLDGFPIMNARGIKRGVINLDR